MNKYVYRFLVKTGDGWRHILDGNKIPLTITTTKPKAIYHIFRRRYPSLAAMYPGESLQIDFDKTASDAITKYHQEKTAKEEQERKEENLKRMRGNFRHKLDWA